MKAYNGSSELKNMIVAETVSHREHDALAQSFGYGKTDDEGKWRGCAIGCAIRTVNTKLGRDYGYSDHGALEKELGIPRLLWRLEDGIFEGLPAAEAQTWPERFASAIVVGADLSGVGDQFMLWLLVDPVDGIIKFAKKDQTRAAIQGVADLYAKKLRGETVTREDWRVAKKAAAAYAYAYADAAAYAAYAAAYAAAAAAYAAYAAADAAAADAYAAADAAAADAYAAANAAAAADAYAAAYARKTARVRQSEKLLELMAAAPVLNQ